MVAFVILNYNSFIETEKCVNSIKGLKYKKIKIIIIDNNTASTYEEKKLKQMADNYYRFKTNVGFAKGNNMGCKIAKENYNPDFICVVNSDTEIKQNDFIKRIYENYKKYKFDMLGPKIISPTNLSANPFPVYKDLKTVEMQINYVNKLIKIYKNIFFRNLLNIYIKLKRIFIPQKVLENGKNLKFNVALHGCFLIFSKNYLDKYKNVFYDKTFLYHEEEFLYYRMIKDNLITMYDPKMIVYHNEGTSLNKTYKNKYKKLIFKNEEILKSLYLYKDVLLKGGRI